MSKTVIRELGGNKNTITNRKTTAHSPQGERVQIRPGTIPKKSY